MADEKEESTEQPTEEELYHTALAVVAAALEDDNIKVRMDAAKYVLKRGLDELSADDGGVLLHIRAAQQYDSGKQHGHTARVGTKRSY